MEGKYLDDFSMKTTTTAASTNSSIQDDCSIIEDQYEICSVNDLDYESIDLDEYMASAAHARDEKGVSAKELSKIWRIDLEAAEKTLGITSQRCKRSGNPTLSHNLNTNDRML